MRREETGFPPEMTFPPLKILGGRYPHNYRRTGAYGIIVATDMFAVFVPVTQPFVLNLGGCSLQPFHPDPGRQAVLHRILPKLIGDDETVYPADTTSDSNFLLIAKRIYLDLYFGEPGAPGAEVLQLTDPTPGRTYDALTQERKLPVLEPPFSWQDPDSLKAIFAKRPGSHGTSRPSDSDS